MPARPLTFHQVMILPTLVTLGLGCMLASRHVSWIQPVDAATLAAAPAARPTLHPALVLDAIPVPSRTTPAAHPLASANSPAAARPPATASAEASVEMRPSGGDRIRATNALDLVRQARENSGREDPFVALVNPDPGLIQPLPAAPTLEVTTTATYQTGSRSSNPARPVILLDPPQAGDEAAHGPLIVPRWQLSGVLNTGREQVALLESNGLATEARLGEMLADGSKVVKIEANRVVLMLNGRRFPKTIGGGDQ